MIEYISNSEGERVSVAGSEYRILIDGKQTNGSYAVIEMNVPPGSGPVPHSHKHMQETFFVVEGEIEFRTTDRTIQAGQGAFVRIPLGGVVHAFKNTSDQKVKLICTVMPAGLEDMFREVSIAGPEKAKEIGQRYGSVYYPADYLG
jgi:quercetin dioxygenase-like cupin family protein